MDIRPLLQTSIVLLAVGAFAYYGFGHDDGDGRTRAEHTGPDYIIAGMQGWQADEQGRPLRRFDGSELLHYAAGSAGPERFEMNAPDIRLYSDGKPGWHLTANQATSTDPGTDIWLEGRVVALRDASQGMPLRVETERLHANPRANRLDTPELVKIAGPQGRMSGRGLTADLQSRTLQFNSAVEVLYAPSRR